MLRALGRVVQKLSELQSEFYAFLDLACRLRFACGFARLHARQRYQQMIKVGGDKALAKRRIAARQTQVFVRDYVVLHGRGHRSIPGREL